MLPTIKQSDATPLPHSASHESPTSYPDYITIKTNYPINVPWETQHILQQFFEKMMHKWLGKNWRERLLGG